MITANDIHRPLGKTGLRVPPIVFGTSCLGNLYQVVPEETKFRIVDEIFQQCPGPVLLDTAGKYGAGMSLEVIGRSLRKLNVPRSQVIISNKLGWYRVPLTAAEPTFEPGIWAGIESDAECRISYDGILQCYEQGSDLLGPEYPSQVVSVHDPDEYLAAAKTPESRHRRFADILGAYRALFELKDQGVVRAVGIGSKDWRVIREIAAQVDLDWVMFACSLTVYSHPSGLLDFVAHLRTREVGMINSAVFHAGFLTGGKWFDYRQPDQVQDRELFVWREKFFEQCRKFELKPADVCIQFGLALEGITAVALNTEKPSRIKENLASAFAKVPDKFWQALKDEKLISTEFPVGRTG